MSTPDDSVPTLECRVCRTDVPAGAFCGLCGDHLDRQRDGGEWLRMRAYCAGRGENLFQPALVSSLFPQLPQHSRAPFRLGVLALVLAVAACTLLRLPAAMIALAALGLPLLFVAYLRETDAFQDLPARTLLLTVTLGAGLGVGWVLATGSMVARDYDMPMGAGIAAYQIMRVGLGIPLGAMLLMLLPVVVVRLLGPRTRESLEGFAIGALGALTFTAAATLSRLAPQFVDGMVARGRPLSVLAIQAGIHAVAVPITAAATGGLFGLALWFTRPANKIHQHPNYVRAARALAIATIPIVYAALGLIDVAQVPDTWVLAVHLIVMVLAVLALRVGLQLALRYEAHDEIEAGEPLLCPHCNRVVPDMAFCPSCGVATRASSRSSRTARRRTRPVRNDAGAP
ncbi:MAG TPA: zinc ribbon domain-containing protein [Mycobacterium sp.]|nr:zinc ribbon domain-containing protein [Mycobacterium sp.]